MTLLLDTFTDEVRARLTANGWVITDYSRYDPTHIVGLTPTGRAFTFDASGNTVTVTIAGRTRTATRTKDQWERGDLVVTALTDLRSLLPVNQQ